MAPFPGMTWKDDRKKEGKGVSLEVDATKREPREIERRKRGSKKDDTHADFDRHQSASSVASVSQSVADSRRRGARVDSILLMRSGTDVVLEVLARDSKRNSCWDVHRLDGLKSRRPRGERGGRWRRSGYRLDGCRRRRKIRERIGEVGVVGGRGGC